jgi:NADPH:quinone reductase-like Zn-dependent oxidoreductase
LRRGLVVGSVCPGAPDARTADAAGLRKIGYGKYVLAGAWKPADRAGMQAIANFVETGALRARIEATFPLAEAAKAHALGETGRTTGKIVLTVEETSAT